MPVGRVGDVVVAIGSHVIPTRRLAVDLAVMGEMVLGKAGWAATAIAMAVIAMSVAVLASLIVV